MYNLGIHILGFFLKVAAFFNHKIRLGVKGRSSAFKILESQIKPEDKCLWFHCASLGEFEQGLPVFEAITSKFPNHKIVLTFFSPSGYEIRKNTPVADVVGYLPLDTKINAKRFVKLVKPELTVFVKYDIWPNYLNMLKELNLKSILISALFRKDQAYFKWYGSSLRNGLRSFEHIFVQNESSKELLSSIQYNAVSISGDTRYDRVSNQLDLDNSLDFISNFKEDSLCVVIGSSWPEDEAILIPFINANASKDLKFIIAPHNIQKTQVEHITSQLRVPYALYSKDLQNALDSYQVFVVDTIGLLSKIYSAADLAYVGGAMGTTGLHNILEPAVFGIPVIIGKNHKKFPEALQMIENAGVIAIHDEASLNSELHKILDSEEYRTELGRKNADFINKSTGAVVQIMDFIRI